MIYVIPSAGLKVADPERAQTPERHLPPEGRLVDESGYWTRRLIDGDVTLGTDPEAPPTPPAPPPAKPAKA